ncbi:hypothetical protein FQR65_LT15304 [Abscondita terminalis]|nr:hypothetical protein FQR65_LT15304 [Abscondita terminalis]
MVQVEGKYILDKNENFKEYLIHIGIPEAIAFLAESFGKKLKISVDGKKYTFDDGSKPSVIVLDEEYDEPIEFKKIVLKSIAKLEGNKIIVTSKNGDEDAGTRIHEFTDTGYIVTLTHAGVTGKRYFKRKELNK